jgi:hypothetical protein
MFGANLAWGLVLWAASALIAILVYGLLRSLINDLVAQTAGMSAASTFFTRVLLLGLLFTALGGCLATEFEIKPDSPSLEYVWRFASGLSEALEGMSLFLFGYLALITLLVGALRRGRDG